MIHNKGIIIFKGIKIMIRNKGIKIMIKNKGIKTGKLYVHYRDWQCTTYKHIYILIFLFHKYLIWKLNNFRCLITLISVCPICFQIAFEASTIETAVIKQRSYRIKVVFNGKLEWNILIIFISRYFLENNIEYFF